MLFYAPDIKGDSYELSEIESRHIVKVLRLVTNDKITLTDGKGNLFHAYISHSNPRKCVVRINEVEKQHGKRNYHLHIAIAPTKNISRYEWFLEKATEIGIDEITPIICKHSERKIINSNRLLKVLITAMKQSLKTFLPKLNPMTNLHQFLDKKHKGQKFMAYIDEENTFTLKDFYKQQEDALILIGPEGDFSLEEVQHAINKSYRLISLGNARLRTETAGVVSCHSIAFLNM